MAISTTVSLSYHIGKVVFNADNTVYIILTKKIDNVTISEEQINIDPNAVTFLLDSPPNPSLTIRDQIMLGIEQYLLANGIVNGVIDTSI